MALAASSPSLPAFFITPAAIHPVHAVSCWTLMLMHVILSVSVKSSTGCICIEIVSLYICDVVFHKILYSVVSAFSDYLWESHQLVGGSGTINYIYFFDNNFFYELSISYSFWDIISYFNLSPLEGTDNCVCCYI